jgi:hypothetical protein
VLLEFGGDRQRQPVNPALARRITGPAVVAEERERAGVDDGSTTLRDHVRRGDAARLERGAEMGVEQVAELCAGGFEDRFAGKPRGARTVHQDVDAAELLYAGVYEGIGDCWVSG